MRVVIIASVLVALASTAAAASDGDDDVSPFVAKSTTIYFVSGLSTPVGFFGFEAEQNLTSFWSLSAGAGFGDTAPQIAAMTHLLLGNAWSKLTVGAGVSRGKYVWHAFEGDEIVEQKSGIVTWANFEIGGEHRWRNGFTMRYFGGYRRVVHGELVCDAGYAGCAARYEDSGYEGYYTGFALGASF